jgi:hypothetical protein
MTDEELEAEFAKAWAEHPYSRLRAAVLELRDAVYEAVGIARLSLLREREEENRRLRALLERARIGAWHEACGDHADPDPCWHCCDWRELAEEIDAALRGEQP